MIITILIYIAWYRWLQTQENDETQSLRQFPSILFNTLLCQLLTPSSLNFQAIDCPKQCYTYIPLPPTTSHLSHLHPIIFLSSLSLTFTFTLPQDSQEDREADAAKAAIREAKVRTVQHIVVKYICTEQMNSLSSTITHYFSLFFILSLLFLTLSYSLSITRSF